MNKLGLLLFVFTTSLFVSVVAFKPTPYYLNALTELRAAQQILNDNMDNWGNMDDEKNASEIINETILEIKNVEHDNNKDLDLSQMQKTNGDKVLLTKVEEYLKKAHEDIKNDTDDGLGNTFKNKTLTNINRALAAVVRAEGMGN